MILSVIKMLWDTLIKNMWLKKYFRVKLEESLERYKEYVKKVIMMISILRHEKKRKNSFRQRSWLLGR